DPEVAVAALLWSHDEHARRIDTQVRRPQRILPHRLDQGQRRHGCRFVPAAQRGTGNLEPFSSERSFLAVQRLILEPPLEDGVREQPGTGKALANRKRERVGDEDRGGVVSALALTHELLADDLNDDGGSRPALEHTAPLLANHLERIEAFALHFGWHEVDTDARPLFGQRPSLGLLPLVLPNTTRLVRRRRRWLPVLAEHQAQDS